MNATTVISILGALGVGSAVGQFVGASRQRREMRGAVLAAVGVCETRRWVDHSKDHDQSFPEVIREFETAALIARIPRSAVVEYATLALAAYWQTKESSEHDPEGLGGISADFSDVVRDAARIVTGLVWSPMRGRWNLQRRLDRITKRAAAVDDEPGLDRMIERARGIVGT